jgi:replicative DNA helicase
MEFNEILDSKLKGEEKDKKTIRKASVHRSKVYLNAIEDGEKFKKSLDKKITPTDWSKILTLHEEREKLRLLSSPFLVDDPFFQFGPGSLVIMLGRTAGGKTTISSQGISYYLQNNKKVLVVSTEETSGDVGARVACFNLGLSFSRYKGKYDPMTKTDKDRVHAEMNNFTNLDVIDNSHNGDSRNVTSVQGGINILEKAKHQGDYDAILIDYLQSFRLDCDVSNSQPWQVQYKFIMAADHIKNEINCPIIIFSQIKKSLHKEGCVYESFESRLKGSSESIVKGTDIYEFFKEEQEFFCWKHRFESELEGSSLPIHWTGRKIIKR